MSFQTWVTLVQAIALQRGLILTTQYVTGSEGQQWVTFNWRAANNTRYGSGGAGAEFIYLTTPEQYTWDWYALPDPRPGVPPPPTHPTPDPVPPNPWQRHGRYVPRIPAMAVADSLLALFKLPYNLGLSK